MFRIALGIIVGLISATLVFLAFQMLNTSFFPPPEGVDFSDQEGMKKFIEGLPATGFLLVLAGYAVGVLAAGFIARKISRHASVGAPIVIGGLFSVGWIMNVLSVPHPTWVVVAGIFIFLPFTYLGHRLAAD
ncbi:MAG: hypothetical protein R2681_08415 [Pyrinomonadaceae bacterium]